MKYIKIKYRLLVYLTSFTVFSRDIKKSSKKKKKKALKMTSYLVIFRAFLFYKKNLALPNQLLGNFVFVFIFSLFCYDLKLVSLCLVVPIQGSLQGLSYDSSKLSDNPTKQIKCYVVFCK